MQNNTVYEILLQKSRMKVKRLQKKTVKKLEIDKILYLCSGKNKKKYHEHQ